MLLKFIFFDSSLAKDPIMSTVIQVYGIAAVPRWDDPSRGE